MPDDITIKPEAEMLPPSRSLVVDRKTQLEAEIRKLYAELEQLDEQYAALAIKRSQRRVGIGAKLLELKALPENHRKWITYLKDGYKDGTLPFSKETAQNYLNEHYLHTDHGWEFAKIANITPAERNSKAAKLRDTDHSDRGVLTADEAERHKNRIFLAYDMRRAMNTAPNKAQMHEQILQEHEGPPLLGVGHDGDCNRLDNHNGGIGQFDLYLIQWNVWPVTTTTWTCDWYSIPGEKAWLNVAHHECGHLCGYLHYGWKFGDVKIYQDTNGQVHGSVHSPAAVYDCLGRAVCCLCGPVAEERLTGVPVEQQPCSVQDVLMTLNALAHAPNLNPPLDVQSLLPFTRTLIEENWQIIQLLASTLLERRQLGYEDVMRLIT